MSSTLWWYAMLPCEKLKRATFIPQRSIVHSVSTSAQLGPSVHTRPVSATRPVLRPVSASTLS